MGYSDKLREKDLAQELRKKGYSYKEMLNKINVSKSTLSLWCRNIKLTKKQYERLYKKKREGG